MIGGLSWLVRVLISRFGEASRELALDPPGDAIFFVCDTLLLSRSLETRRDKPEADADLMTAPRDREVGAELGIEIRFDGKSEGLSLLKLPEEESEVFLA